MADFMLNVSAKSLNAKEVMLARKNLFYFYKQKKAPRNRVGEGN